MKSTRRAFSATLAIAALALLGVASSAQNPSPQTNTTDILAYIRQTWTTLTRSNKDLPKAAVDPKFHPGPDGRWPVFVPRNESAAKISSALEGEIPEATFKTIDIRQLPEDTSHMQEQGLLYLPRPYVVPGGRFNEMYGWDSYFIQVGLLRDERTRSGQGYGRQLSV